MFHTPARLVMTAAATVAIGPIATRAAVPALSADPLGQFERRIAAYMKLHQEVEAQLPPLRVTGDFREVEAAVNAMATAMRSARATAKAGDIITAEVGEVFRNRIANALSQRKINADELLAAILEEDLGEEMKGAVNGRFVFFAMTPALILEALPKLPSELQYRFVGRDLALVDIHSNLIVDILPQALSAHDDARVLARRIRRGTIERHQDPLPVVTWRGLPCASEFLRISLSVRRLGFLG